MAWLVSDARVLASAEIAGSRRDRGRGLIGRESVDGAFVLPRCRWVHTMGMKVPLDVAYLDAEGVVVKVVRMPPRRIGAPVWAARTVVEAEAGAIERWGLHLGDVVEVRD